MFSLFNQYKGASSGASASFPRQLSYSVPVPPHTWTLCHRTPRQQPAAKAPKAPGPSQLESKQGADTAPTAPKLRNCTLYSTWWLWCHISRDTTGKRGPPPLSLSRERDRQKQPGSGQHVCCSNPQPDWKAALSSDKFQNEEINTKCGGVHTNTIKLEV